MCYKIGGTFLDTLAKILNLLNERNIKQQEFAKAIGVRKQAISEWKNGTTKSYMKYIDKIADYFNVSTDYLLGNKTHSEVPDPLFLEELNGLTESELEDVKEYIKFLKSKRKDH